MDAIVSSFVLVFISEMGDKTQLLALVLAARYKKIMPIMFGVLVATLLNHALASYLGAYITHYISENILKWILGLSFIGFGLWILIPDKDEELKTENKWGPFLTTVVAFFFAEMGDKTQLATVALGAKFAAPLAVTIGSTGGMMLSNWLAVVFGAKLTQKISMTWIHRIASALFIIFGVTILVS